MTDTSLIFVLICSSYEAGPRAPHLVAIERVTELEHGRLEAIRTLTVAPRLLLVPRPFNSDRLYA